MPKAKTKKKARPKKTQKAEPTAKQTIRKGECELTICEHPDTGVWYVKAKGPCAPGFVEKAKRQIAKHGLGFPYTPPSE